MYRPKVVSPGSIMPAYTWMHDDDLDVSLLERKIRAMQTLGVPYPEGYDKIAIKDLEKQAHEIASDIVLNTPKSALKGINAEEKIKEIEKKEIIALIAYLQRMGTDIKVKIPNK